MSTLEVDGTLTRQLLPWPVTTAATRAQIRAMYRFVTWVVEPVTYEQAEAHLGIGGPAACVVMVFRGPKGGWTDAQFVNRDTKLPRPKLRRVNGPDGTITGVMRTLYYGWVHTEGHPRDTMMPIPQWRATLALHAGA